MVQVAGIKLNEQAKTAKVDLEADTKAEMENITTADIKGFPAGYTMEFMSSCFTASADLGFLQSDGTWNWGEE